MFRDLVLRLIREDEGMEMVEWSLVGGIFAIACAFVWGALSGDVNSAVTSIGDCVSNTASCG